MQAAGFIYRHLCYERTRQHLPQHTLLSASTFQGQESAPEML